MGRKKRSPPREDLVIVYGCLQCHQSHLIPPSQIGCMRCSRRARNKGNPSPKELIAMLEQMGMNIEMVDNEEEIDEAEE